MSDSHETDTRRITVTAENFTTEVLEKSKHTAVLLDFWAPWCAPCRQLLPVLERLAAEQGDGLILAKANADEQPQLAARLGIRSLPTVALFKNGEVAAQFVGALSETQVRSRLQSHLASVPESGPAVH